MQTMGVKEARRRLDEINAESVPAMPLLGGPNTGYYRNLWERRKDHTRRWARAVQDLRDAEALADAEAMARTLNG